MFVSSQAQILRVTIPSFIISCQTATRERTHIFFMRDKFTIQLRNKFNFVKKKPHFSPSFDTSSLNIFWHKVWLWVCRKISRLTQIDGSSWNLANGKCQDSKKGKVGNILTLFSEDFFLTGEPSKYSYANHNSFTILIC